jgi:2-polyprenyl-3-methyl-5-hydroxy-6-metoxy-1,4-benzoquinol methylase
MRRLIKNFFRYCNLLSLFDLLHFCLDFIRHAPRNLQFKWRHPEIHTPPLRFLHETYRCDLQQYWEDGLSTATEIIETVKPLLRESEGWHVLDWGCGVGRITRHLRTMPEISSLTGADINPGMIAWNRTHFPDIQFETLPPEPAANLQGDSFHLVIGISVLTHIPCEKEPRWLEEILRLLKPGGIFIFTTHGESFCRILSPMERTSFESKGCVTQSFEKDGHRMMTTIHHPEILKKRLQQTFELLAFKDGRSEPEAAGGQDLWIIRKPEAKD